jgi:hypothetical protein
MSARSPARLQFVPTLIRTSQRSRLEAQCLSSAYELALPIVRRRAAESPVILQQASASSFVPQRRLGG